MTPHSVKSGHLLGFFISKLIGKKRKVLCIATLFFTYEVIAKVLDLLTDGKADDGVRLAMSEFSGLIVTFAISSSVMCNFKLYVPIKLEIKLEFKIR